MMLTVYTVSTRTLDMVKLAVWDCGSSMSRICLGSQELAQATPDQLGDCPKGRAYGLGSLGSRKRRYDDLGASTSLEPMVPRSKFDNIVDQLKTGCGVHAEPIWVTMDGAGLSQQPPPPQERQQQEQMDPTDPLQHDDVDRRER
ncbi:hypothetical protein Sjap_000301 [Stephania japonica]|uniref:Uncharacterized protein n=1 Tax=Stephania japonica TaxID=461633 RepID=A0AAP0KHS2_9MAGN